MPPKKPKSAAASDALRDAGRAPPADPEKLTEGLTGRGLLELRLQRLVVELRVQSLGLDLRGLVQMSRMKMRKTCNNTRGRSDVINWARPA